VILVKGKGGRGGGRHPTLCPANTKVANQYGPNTQCSQDTTIYISHRGPTLIFVCMGCTFKKLWTEYTACITSSLTLELCRHKSQFVIRCRAARLVCTGRSTNYFGAKPYL